MFLPVVGERLVELSVLLVADVVWRPSPDWLCLVQLLVLAVLLFDCLLLLLVLLLSISILPNVLNLGLFSLGIPGLGLVVRHLLLPLLLAEHLDRVADGLRVLLHHLLLNELSLVLFHVQDNLRPSLQFRVIARPDCEGTSGGGLPNVLLVIVVL